MLKKKKPVLDEREMMEMYRIEHHGFWLLYGLLCAAVVVQLLAGCAAGQMAGELAALIVVSVVMIIANARQGIWEADARPSAMGNAKTALLAALAVSVLVGAMKRSARLALTSGAAMFALCFALLGLMMAYVRRRQRAQEAALEDEEDATMDEE